MPPRRRERHAARCAGVEEPPGLLPAGTGRSRVSRAGTGCRECAVVGCVARASDQLDRPPLRRSIASRAFYALHRGRGGNTTTYAASRRVSDSHQPRGTDSGEAPRRALLTRTPSTLFCRQREVILPNSRRGTVLSDAMAILQTKLDPTQLSFKANDAHHRRLADELRALSARTALGGDERSRARHVERGKLLARDRIDRLLDQGSAFLEIGQLAGHELYEDIVPAGGLVTGIGRVSGRDCVIVVNDATVKGGTYYPITVKKHLRAQEIALENRLPCIYMVDSGGAFLPMQDQVFPDKEHFGRIFYNQANMSARGIPQIAIVMGSCTA